MRFNAILSINSPNTIQPSTVILDDFKMVRMLMVNVDPVWLVFFIPEIWISFELGGQVLDSLRSRNFVLPQKRPNFSQLNRGIQSDFARAGRRPQVEGLRMSTCRRCSAACLMGRVEIEA